MRVLVVQGHYLFRHVLPVLRKTKFALTTSNVGEEALYYATSFTYDVIMLDFTFQNAAGVELIEQIRKARVDTPIIVVSTVGDPHEIAQTLDAGADRYLVKGFHPDELIALTTAIIRRSHGYSESKISIGDLVVDMRSKKVSVQGKPVHLPYGKYRVLEVLALHKGELLSQRQIYEFVYNDEVGGDISVINVFVCLIRKRLSLASGGKKYIETVRGIGYVLREA